MHMMDSKAAVKVGITVLIGTVLLVTGYYFFAKINFSRYPLRVEFADTQGLQRQTPIRMNGVNIGDVAEVRLQEGSLKPLIVLNINNEYKRRIPRNSHIRITSGLLISNPQIQIEPGTPESGVYEPNETWDKEYVQTQPAGALASLSPEADATIKQLGKTLETLTPKLVGTVEGVQKTIAQVQGILKRTDVLMNNFVEASASARRLVSDPKIQQTLQGMLADFRDISSETKQTVRTVTAEIRGIAKRNGGKLDELANGTIDLLQKFSDTVDAARGAVTKLTEQVSDPRLQQSLQETLDLTKATIARFGQIATDIQQITGDPMVQSDLKTSISNVKETTEEVQRLTERVNKLVGGIKVPNGKTNFGIGSPSFTVDVIGRTNAPNFRSDVNLRVPVGKNAFDLGLYDFGDKYRLNAQYETGLGANASLRYGIYASKLGVGYNVELLPGTRLVLDAFNPNNLQVDARALFRLNSDFSLWVGADSLFKRTTPLLGVQLKR